MSNWNDFASRARDFRNEFNNAAKRVLKTSVSTNPRTLRRNLRLIIESYNELVLHLSSNYNNFNLEQQNSILVEFKSTKSKLLKCFYKFNLIYDDDINLHTLVNIGKLIKIKSELETFNLENIFEEIDSSAMAAEFLKTAAPILGRFNGSPSDLNSWISSLELLEDLATNEQKLILFKLAKGRLDGKAADSAIGCVDLNDLKIKLRSTIKHEASQVVEARLLATHMERKSLADFTKEVGKLADDLNRSLITEGTSITKAKELTIARVVETCRKSAHNDLVKTVLAAGNFQEPNEVLAKFTVEVSEQVKDRQVLAYRQQQRQRNFNNNNNFGNNNRNNKNNNNNRVNFGDYGSRGNNNNNFANNNNRNNFGSYNNRNNNFNNRGGYNGNRGNYNRNRANVRLFNQGNEEVLDNRHVEDQY